MIAEFLDLNAFQALLVNANIGPVGIAGGPGTGKTQAMLARVLSMMSLGMRPDDVFLITPHDHLVPRMKALLERMPQQFQERRDRLQGNPWDIEDLGRAVEFAARVSVRTPYQYAHHLLTEHGQRPSTVWSDAEAIAVIDGLERTFAREYDIHYEQGPYTARRFFEWQNIQKLLLPGNPSMPVPVEGWAQLDDAYTRLKNRQHACDRQDLLANAHRLIRAPMRGEGIFSGKQRPHILVDDFQDITDPFFWFLYELCGRQQSLSVAIDPGQPAVGDPPFRALELFLGVYPAAQVHRLQASFRATRSITATVERIAWYGRPNVPLLYPGYVGLAERERAVRLHVLSGRRDLGTAYVYRLVEESRGNGNACDDIAVMGLDSRNVAPINAAFWARGVPSLLDSTLPRPNRTLAESRASEPLPHARQIINALRLLKNKHDPASLLGVLSMGLTPDRSSLNAGERAQISRLSWEGNINLLEAARQLIQPLNRRHRIYRILTPLLALFTALEQAIAEVRWPQSIRQLVEAANRILADMKPVPPTPRDEAQVAQLLQLSGAYRIPRGQTVSQVLGRFLDSFSPGLHPSSHLPHENRLADDDDGVTITTADGAVGRWWRHVIVLTGGNRPREQALTRRLFRAASAAGTRLDIIVAPLTTAGCDADTLNAVRDVIGDNVEEVNVTRQETDNHFGEW